MKKLVFGLIAVVMCGISTFGQSYSNLKPEEFGKLHNEIVELFEKSGKDFSKYKDYKEFLFDFQKLVNNKYPNLMKNEDVNNLTINFVKEISKPNFELNFNTNLDKLYSEKRITKNTYDNLIRVNNSDSFETVLEIIADLENNELSTSDLEAIKAFKSVLISSNYLWKSSNSVLAKLDKTDKIIIADALGAFIWFYTGPFSVAAGAAYSIAVNHCGGC